MFIAHTADLPLAQHAVISLVSALTGSLFLLAIYQMCFFVCLSISKSLPTCMALVSVVLFSPNHLIIDNLFLCANPGYYLGWG